MSHRTHRNRSLLNAVTRELLDTEFQRSFYETAVRIDPKNLECLMQLGDLYSRRGQYEKGLEIDSKLVTLCPEEPIFHYNQACSYSRLNCISESLAALRLAIELGFEDLESIEEDEDLEILRSTQEYQKLLRELQADNQT